jgi:hypothetical protein
MNMYKKIWVIDTCVLLAWLDVPGKNTCEIEGEKWDKSYVEELIQQAENTTLVLPLATLIETGNHIAQIKKSYGSQRYPLAQKLAELLIEAIDEKSPWAAFTEQYDLWEEETLKKLAKEWPPLAAQADAKKDKGGLSMGDVTIKWIAEYYADMGYHVKTLTGDQGLKSYEPVLKTQKPPRRRKYH